jgi:sulfur relay (sulfurtransferase) complex TusBCD TusD component (DsrE family)
MSLRHTPAVDAFIERQKEIRASRQTSLKLCQCGKLTLRRGVAGSNEDLEDVTAEYIESLTRELAELDRFIADYEEHPE